VTTPEHLENNANFNLIDARIAELERELGALKSQKLQMFPPPVTSAPLIRETWAPPVVGRRTPAYGNAPFATKPLPNSLSGAQVVLALGGVVLAAATISFGAFMWPRLTTTMRVLVLSLVVAALGVAAVFVKRKLNSLAEALAVGSAASLIVLMLLWYNARAGSLESAGGVGLILLVYAFITGIASLLSKLKSWEYIASGVATFAVVVLCNFDVDPYLVSGVGALVLGVLAWRLLWWHLLCGSGLLGAASVVLLSIYLDDFSLDVPRELPFALLLVVLGLAYNHSGRSPVELQESVRYIGAGFVAISGIAAIFSTFEVITGSSAGVVERIGAVLILASSVFFSNKVPRLRDATKPLLLLALVVATSGLAPLWLCVAVVIAYLLYPTDISVVVFAAAMACTAAVSGGVTTGLITGGSPIWFILAASAVLPFAWALKTKVAELVLLGGVLVSGSVLVATENVTTELRTLPVALVLALCWVLAKQMQPVLITTWFLVPSVALALSASTYYAIDGVGSDMLWRTAVVAGISSVLVAAGVKWKLAGLLVPGFAALCLVSISRVLDVADDVPVWVPLIGAAVVLLVAGARFEYLEAQRKRTLNWARDLR
jgi:hypothetical protein